MVSTVCRLLSFSICVPNIIFRQCYPCEKQDVRAATGKLSAEGAPLVRLERAAMIYFGVPSFGVHLNGFVKATGKMYVVDSAMVVGRGKH